MIWYWVGQSIDRILKYEAFVFYILLILHAAPVIHSGWFPTVDGPAHLYNSRLILDAITGVAELPVFMEFGDLTSNWLGHAILVVLLAIMSAEWAETCIQLLQVLGFPLAFRFVIHVMKGKKAFAVLAFPFSYSFLFFYGFYNFNLSVILALLTLGVWWRGLSSLSSGHRMTVVTLSMLTGFSHIFGLIFLLLLTGLLIVARAIGNDNKVSFKEVFTSFVLYIPSLVLLVVFVVNSVEIQNPNVYQSTGELWRNLYQVAPAKGIDYGKEGVFSQWILYMNTLMLLVFPLVLSKQAKFRKACIISLGLSTALLLFAYFTLPDGKVGYAGFVSARLLLFFFVSLALTMAMVQWPKWLTFIVLFITAYISVGMLGIYIKSNRNNAIVAREIVDLSSSIRVGSVILPYISSEKFIFGHITGYLGSEKHLILLDNYEAALRYFPLSWKNSHLMNFTLNGQDYLPFCLPWPTNLVNAEMEVDYVLLVEDQPSECTIRLRMMLDSTHVFINSTSEGPLFLYERRR